MLFQRKDTKRWKCRHVVTLDLFKRTKRDSQREDLCIPVEKGCQLGFHVGEVRRATYGMENRKDETCLHTFFSPP